MKLLIAAVILFFLLSCREQIDFQLDDRSKYNSISEIELLEIKLEGEISRSESEISGLAWYKDYLILLPQFPYLFGDGLTGSLFYIPKVKIENYIHAKSDKYIKPEKLKLYADGLEEFNKWGSGYEAIIFNDDNVYIVFESYKNSDAFIVKGSINFQKKIVILEQNSLQKINIPIKLPNLTAETITLFEDKILVINEVNGKNLTSIPTATVFNLDLTYRSEISIPSIEYRITDATKVQPDSTFWAINYLWPGEINYIKPQDDSLFNKYGIGNSQKESLTVERLIKLKIVENKIKFADQKPIYIYLDTPYTSRNWEGLVKFDDLGFLIATDRFPRTILGFIPFSE